MTGPTPEQLKMATREQWDASASGWNAQTPRIRAWLAEVTQEMLDLAGVRRGSRVLDVAAGAGDQTLDAARRAGSDGSVLATDLSPQILGLAAMNARAGGLANVEIKVADGEDLGLGEAGFDAAICRLGLMFFPEPSRGLHEIGRALRPGGRFCAVVFSEPRSNPCVGIVFTTALRHAGLPAGDPFQPGGLFSLAKPGLIEDLFAGAGFRDVRAIRMSAPFKAASAQDYVEFIRTSAGPVIAILSKLDEEARAAAWADIVEKLSVFQTPQHWEGPGELLLAVGTR